MPSYSRLAASFLVGSPKLAAQIRRTGTSPTHAIRHALEIAARNKRQEDLRADAARLAANPEYQAEIRAVREELDELRAW